MFSSLEKIGLVCISIVGFQITRFLFKTLYDNLIGPKLGINAVNLKDMGRWAGRVQTIFFYLSRGEFGFVQVVFALNGSYVVTS